MTARAGALRWKRIPQFIGTQDISLLAALLILVIYIASQRSAFLLSSNLLTIGAAISLLGLVSLAQTVTIIAGGLDVSIGPAVGLVSVIAAKATGSGLPAALLIALTAGAVAGLANGLIVQFGRVNPIITTLATYSAFQGLTFIVANNKAVSVTDSAVLKLGSGRLAGIPLPLVILFAVAVLFFCALAYTVTGRRVYAIGGNPEAARIAGINVGRYTVGIYVLGGLVAGLTGLVLTARTGAGLANSGAVDLSLQSITAVLLGGAALSGGRGSVVSTMLAVTLLGVLQNGLTLLSVPQFYQYVAQGVLLVGAVMIQEYRGVSLLRLLRRARSPEPTDKAS